MYKSEGLSSARFWYEETNDLDWLVDKYVEWATRKDYCVFKRVSDGKIVAVDASKRGNAVYRWRVLGRFKQLQNRISDLSKLCGEKRSQLLYVTLTYGGKYRGADTWSDVGKHWNQFMYEVRRAYGEVYAVRTFEAQKDGTPHIHAVLFFMSSSFAVFPHRSKRNSRMYYRIHGVGKRLKKFWRRGHSDWSGVLNLERLFNYIFKYLAKNLKLVKENSKGMALMWVHRKRSFSISRNLLRLAVNSITKTPEEEVDEKEAWILVGVFTCEIDLRFVDILWMQLWKKGGPDGRDMYDIQYRRRGILEN